jgi:hypothetical protein
MKRDVFTLFISLHWPLSLTLAGKGFRDVERENRVEGVLKESK